MKCILALLFIYLISINSHAQKKCSEIVKSEVVANIEGIEFKFSNTDKSADSLGASLESLISLMDQEPSQVSRSIENHKILELKKYFSGSEEKFYEKFRIIKSKGIEVDKSKMVNKNPPKLKMKRVDGKEIAQFKVNIVVFAIALDDGRFVAGYQNNVMIVWRPEGDTYKEVGRFKHKDLDKHRTGGSRIRQIIKLKEGGRLATGAYDGTVRIWKPEGDTYEEVAVLEQKSPAAANSITELKDGRIAVVASWRPEIHIWKSVGGSYEYVETQALESHKDTLLSVIELSDGRILTSSKDKTLRAWRGDGQGSYKETAEIYLEQRPEFTVELSDGRLAIGIGAEVQLWGPVGYEYEQSGSIKGHSEKVISLVELKNGRLATGSNDSTVRIWEAKGDTYFQVGKLEGHRIWVGSVDELLDGRLVTGSGDRTVRVWDLEYIEEEL